MQVHPNEIQEPVDVPPSALSAEALKQLIESFILREGTDYGRTEVSMAEKYKQVYQQIQRNYLKVVFDPNSESVTLLTNDDFNKLKSEFSQVKNHT